MSNINFKEMDNFNPDGEIGDDGFYLEDTPESLDYMKYGQIKSLESSGASFDEIIYLVGITESEYDQLKKKFEILRES